VKIVIPDDYQDVATRVASYALIREHDVTRYADAAHDLDTLVERLRDADVVVSIRERLPISRSLLERLPKLKLIALLGRTAATIDFAACTELGIPVATGKSNSPESPAEHTVALMLSSRRGITREAEGMKRGALPSTVAHRLHGSTLGIFGLGAIGTLVAEAGKGLGMRILVWGRGTSQAKAQSAGYDIAGNQAEFFSRADVVSLHVRLTKETRGIVRREDLAQMKPTALLINTGRAELIESGALLAALRQGRPGFAAVDVYEEEPVPADHPFLTMPNVLCTPHSAWAEWDNFELYSHQAYEQIVAFERGSSLRLANPTVKPRARSGA